MARSAEDWLPCMHLSRYVIIFWQLNILGVTGEKIGLCNHFLVDCTVCACVCVDNHKKKCRLCFFPVNLQTVNVNLL